MNKKQLPICLIALVTMAPLWSMDNKSIVQASKPLLKSDQLKALQPLNRVLTPNTVSIKKQLPITTLPSDIENKENGTFTFVSNTDKTNFPYLTQGMYNDTSFNNYSSKQFVCNQEKTIKAMNNAHARGAQVDLEVGSHPQNNMTEYNVTKTTRNKELHAKVIVALDSSPSKKTPTKGKFLLSSANDSNNGWLNNLSKPTMSSNFEAGILVENNIPLATQMYKMTQSQSPMKSKNKKNVITDTPEKASIYSSKTTQLNTSWAKRLFNLAQDTSDNRSALLRTMNVNDKEIIEASIKAKESGANIEWQVNHTSITKNGTPLLEQLNSANIPVHVFYPSAGSRSIQHVKDITIRKGDKSLYINSNGNFTQEGDDQVNFATLIPNNAQITTDATADFKRNQTKCILLPEALQLKAEDNKKKAEKRKLEKAAAKEPVTKKKKNQK